MKTSCISHPPNEPLIVIRHWQVELCGGNTTAAALLSFFEYWHNIKLEMQGRASRSNDIAEAHGDNRTQDESLLQFHTEEELISGIMIAKRDTIRKALGYLKDCGFISIHTNPNPKYAFDKTRYFLFHPDSINEWLNEKRPLSNIPPSKTKNRQRSSENQSRQSENQSTITEITPEITSETTSENKSPYSPPGDTIAQEVPIEVEILGEEEETIDTHSLESPKGLSLFERNSNPGEDKTSEGGVATKSKNKKTKAADKSLQAFFDAYHAEKPSNFTNHRELSEKQVRSIRKLIAQYKERSLDVFVGALTWCREQDSNWWRDKPLSLDELFSNGKVVSYADKHFHALEADPAYCDRVEGRAVSKDPKRNNGFQVFNEQGKEVTGASARAAAAVASDPMLALFLEQI